MRGSRRSNGHLPESELRGGLRRHLAVVLIVAALVPLALLALLSALLLLGSVDGRMRDEARRGLEVAQSLLLRQVHAVAARATALADDGRVGGGRALLAGAVERGGGVDLEAALRTALGEGGAAALIEVANASGDVLVRCAAGGCVDVAGTGPQGELHSPDRSPSILRALAYERTVSIEPTRRLLAVRAAMPLASAGLALTGVVVVSMPLDGPFADRLKAALGSQRDVIFYTGTEPSASTLTSPAGERIVGPRLPPAALQEGAAEVPVLTVSMGEQALAVAFGRILDADGRTVGTVGVAIDREPFFTTRRRAATVLALGVLAALALALLLGRALGGRMSRTLGELHAGALALARGDANVSFPTGARDELGGLAQAFRSMAASVIQRQRLHTESGRQLQLLLQLGRDLGAAADTDTVLQRAAATAREAVDAGMLTAVLLHDLDGGVPRVVVQGAPEGMVCDAFISALRRVDAPGAARAVLAGEDDAVLGSALRAGGLTGPLLVVPLALHSRHSGAMLALLHRQVGSDEAVHPAGGLELLGTIAGLTAAAVDRVRLLAETRSLADQVELKVRERTVELERAGAEAERALRELHDAQARAVAGEQAAGAGTLAAQMALALSGPMAAMRAQTAALAEAVRLLQERTGTLLRLPGEGLDRYLAALAGSLSSLAQSAPPSAPARRELQRLLADRLEGVESAEDAAALVAPLGAQAEALLPAIVDACHGEAVLELSAHAAAAVRVARLAWWVEHAAVWFARAERAVQSCARPSHEGRQHRDLVDAAAALEDAIVVLSPRPDGSLSLSRPSGELPPTGAAPGEIDVMWVALLQHVLRSCGAAGGGGEPVVTAGGMVDDGALVFTLDCPGLPLLPGAPARLGEAVRSGNSWSAPDAGLVLAARLVARQNGELELQGDALHTCLVVRLPLVGAGGDP